MAIKLEKILQNYELHCAKLRNATRYNLRETPAEKSKRIAELESDYIKWFQYHFPTYAKKPCAKFHKDLANKIIKNKTIRILAEWYRSAAKSVHIDMGLPLYLMFVKKDLKFMLLVGETDHKAKKLLSGIQAQLTNNQRLINDYGECFNSGDWAEGDFLTKDGVRFMSIGFMGNPRGAREAENRPDFIAVDDVDNKRHINNDRMMGDAIDFITEDIWGCFDTDEDAITRFVYANNNFHKNSITNRLKQYFLQSKESAKQNNVKDIFHVSTINAVKDLNTFEPTWKERNSADFWRQKFYSMPYRSFMREFMNTHIQDGKIFKYEDIVFGASLSLEKYEALIFYGDLSYKDTGDYKALILVGKIGREFHVIHCYLRRGSRAKCAEWLYNLYQDKHLDLYNIQYKIEGLFAMDDFVNDFDIEGDKRGWYIPVVADKKPKEGKFDRVESMSGYFERKNVIFNEKEANNPDQITLRDQLLAFEKGSSANDDGPDALQSGMAYLNKVTVVNTTEIVTTPRSAFKKYRF